MPPAMPASPDWFRYANVRFTMCVPSKLGDPLYARDEVRLKAYEEAIDKNLAM